MTDFNLKVVPIYCPQHEHLFVDPSLVTPIDIEIDGFQTKTTPLKIGTEVDLKKVCQFEALSEIYSVGKDDMIGPAMKMTNVYVKIGTNILKVDVSHFPGAFLYPNIPEILSKEEPSKIWPASQLKLDVDVNLDVSRILISKNTKNIDGSALSAPLDAIAANDWYVHASLQMNGHFNLRDCIGVICSDPVKITRVYDNVGNLLDMSNGIVSEMISSINETSPCVIGYDMPDTYWAKPIDSFIVSYYGLGHIAA